MRPVWMMLSDTSFCSFQSGKQLALEVACGAVGSGIVKGRHERGFLQLLLRPETEACLPLSAWTLVVGY